MKSQGKQFDSVVKRNRKAMKKLLIIAALISATPGQCANFEGELNQVVKEARLRKGFDKIEETLNFMQFMITTANEKTINADWFHGSLQDLACDIARDYTESYGIQFKDLPLKFRLAEIIGVQDNTVMSALGKLNRKVFNPYIINDERTKGFIYGQASTFSMKRAMDDKNKYLIDLVLTSKDKLWEAVYKGMIDLKNPGSYLDLVGPEGRRLSLNLAESREKPLTRIEFYRAFKSLLNLNSKTSKAVFESRLLKKLDDIREIRVDPRIPNGVYSFKYIAGGRSIVRDEVTGRPLKDNETDEYSYVTSPHIASISSINEEWRTIVDKDEYPEVLPIGPGFKVFLEGGFDPIYHIPSIWFEVRKSANPSPLSVWGYVDWDKVESQGTLDYGRKDIQTLLFALGYSSPQDAFFMAKQLVPAILKRLDELKESFTKPATSQSSSPRSNDEDASLFRLTSCPYDALIPSPRSWDETARFSSRDTLNSPRLNPDVGQHPLNQAQDLPTLRRKVATLLLEENDLQ